MEVRLVALWFTVFKQGLRKTRAGMSHPNLIGEVGLLTREVAPFRNGEVRFQKPMLGSDVWPCMADEVIPAGTRVKVLTVEGSYLKVGKS